MIESIDFKYMKTENAWVCKKCEHPIYSGKNYKKTFCKCLNNKTQYEIYTNYLCSFYNIVRTKWICKKCSSPVGANREQHAFKCLRELAESSIFSKNCDMGCGCESKFFYKSGKAYCSKLGNSCPIKKDKDSAKKININPFENRSHPKGMSGKTPYNKGLTKETSEIIARSSLTLKATIAKNGHSWTGKHRSQVTKDKISKYAKENNYGGYKPGSGRGKKGWYKGFFCDSSWELAYVIYHLDHNIPIKRNTKKRLCIQ